MHLHYMSVAMNNIASGFTASSKQPAYPTKLTAITNARVFDGERVIEERTVVIDGSHIRGVGGLAPTGASIIAAHGATLMPGLVDAHVHTNVTARMTRSCWRHYRTRDEWPPLLLC